jgi:hypothetical protein
MVTRRSAVNFSLGYTYQGIDYYDFSDVDFSDLFSPNEHLNIKKEKVNAGGFNIRVGFEF